MATEHVLYSSTSATHSGTGPHKLHGSTKLLHLSPALYSLMHKAVILNTCSAVGKFLAEQ